MADIPNTPTPRKVIHQIPTDLLNDLSSRFVINVPEEERVDLIRVCFQIELAHWFYLDFYCEEDLKLPKILLKDFIRIIFGHIPFLQKYSPEVDFYIAEWREYKRNVPTYGAILLDQELKNVLLVQSFVSKASWGFPKGKVNKDEQPHHCAIREVLEETGFDISHLIDKQEYLEHNFNEQLIRLYIITGIPPNVKFHTRTRKEIKSIEWFPVNILPTGRKDQVSKNNLGPINFFVVTPFVKQLKKWIASKSATLQDVSSDNTGDSDKLFLQQQNLFAKLNQNELANYREPKVINNNNQPVEYKQGRSGHKTYSPPPRMLRQKNLKQALENEKKKNILPQKEERINTKHFRRALDFSKESKQSRDKFNVKKESIYPYSKTWANFSLDTESLQTSNDTSGVRGVVEYDDFTDDDEEMSSSNISSSKQETFSTYKSSYENVRQRENVQDNLRQSECNKSEVTQSEMQQNLPKRKFVSKVDECEDLSFKKSKQKENLDIDSLFTNHSNNSKYGFGFSRQDKLNMESDFFCSTSSHHQIGTSKGPHDYKAISFIKSDHVFNLNTVNKKVTFGGNSSSSEACRNHTENEFDSESIYRPGPSGLNGIKDLNSRDNDSNKPGFMQIEALIKRYSDLENIAKSSLHCNAKTSSLSEMRHNLWHKDVSSSRTNGHFRRENTEDLDRTLCKAVKANTKKSESIPAKPSSSSSVSSNLKCKTDSPVTKKTNAECAKSVTKSGSLSDDIVNLSSILIEKLSFLISNHSTLTSLSSLLIQIQTRLIDWQAGSLESKYFMSRLQEVQQYLQHYEIGAVSGDWTCQWDRENKRYFYLNSRTQQSQWTYPDELCGKENSWMPSSTDMASTSASSEVSVERDELQTVSSSVPEGQLNKSSTFKAESSKGSEYSESSWLSDYSPPSPDYSPPPPPPGVDSPPPPPPPPNSPPSDSPPPPPPDSTEVEDIVEDMDIENSDDSNPTLIVANHRADTPSDNHIQFSKFVGFIL